jgi:hypothetical protein
VSSFSKVVAFDMQITEFVQVLNVKLSTIYSMIEILQKGPITLQAKETARNNPNIVISIVQKC